MGIGGEKRRQDVIERAARSALRRAGISTAAEKGSAIVYEYALGLSLRKLSAVPGLLVQLPGRWYFAAERSGHADVIHAIDPLRVRDMRSLNVPDGVVVVIEVMSDVGPPQLVQLLVTGSDASSSALQIGYAIGLDAGLVDATGKPTDVWKKRVENAETTLEQLGRDTPDPSVPSGMGYMQSITGVPASGAYKLISDGDHIRGDGAAEDALLVEWNDVEEYWQGQVTHPDWFSPRSGNAIVLTLNRRAHGPNDLVIDPNDLAVWQEELDRQGFDPW